MSELLSTDVLAVLNVDDYIFVGIGYTLRTYRKSCATLISKLDVCYPDKIHGIIKGPGNYLVVFGGKNLSIVGVDYYDELVETTLLDVLHQLNDWIIAVGLSGTENDTNRLAILFAHNKLCLYDWTEQQSKEFQCEENCILYGGSVISDKNENCLVLAGTVFQEIVIWAVNNVADKKIVPVLHRLTGHKGVIFSIKFDFATRLICSTSDDRTIRLWSVEFEKSDCKTLQWENAVISLRTTMFGHTARIWRALIWRDFVLSIGEDSLICIWTTKGTLINKIEAHHGAPIWCIDISEDGNTIITGGGDGAVHVWPLRENSSFETKIIPMENVHEVPKHIGILSSSTLVFITQSGKIITHNTELGINVESIDLKLCTSYILMQISPNKKHIALASLNGYLTLYKDENGTGSLHRVLEEKIVDSKILSMHWLSNDSLLLCGIKGLLKLVKIVNGITLIESEHKLPQSRERWTTAAIIHKNLLICGDRAGSIHLYRKTHSEYNAKSVDKNYCINPFQSLLKIHGRLGVHSCTIVGNKLLSTGRDGTLRFFELLEIEGQKTMSELHINKMPMDWVSTISETSNDIYVLGFKEVDFVLYSTAFQRVLLRIPCGGGHRSWDYTLNSTNFQFVYIRDKRIYFSQCQLHSLANPAIQNGFHSKEIYCIRRIPTCTNHNILISGGEDRELRITCLTNSKTHKNSQELNTIARLSGHISSIKALSLISLQDTTAFSENLIFSGGGRAQLKVWRIRIRFDQSTLDESSLSCTELASHMLRGTDQEQRKTLQHVNQQSYYMDPETRYMDISVLRIPANLNTVLLVIGCSDGFLRIFSYNILMRTVVAWAAIPYENRCIIKTHLLIHAENTIALTMTTDGFVNFWSLNDIVDAFTKNLLPEKKISSTISYRPFASLRLHQCGINSYDLKKLTESEFILATGGDDNLICLSVLEIGLENGVLFVREISKWNCSSAHSTQITGLILAERSTLISVGMDQKVLRFNYIFARGKLSLSLKDEVITAVADVQGIISCHTHEICDVLLCIYGKGLELIRRTIEFNTTIN
ncbi:WD repeat-containing protein 6 [Athalia rosae]|uniref:WD repeat-containing protein 6 n=1 Tax=Athalia rosae TaxID=37344 RepID=UPI0020340A4E|nr:WD repeat-containing protein 6 [Athalia rosae]XP_048504695.1 WD repeat-containing protein 6 [Athalia rosae]